MTFSKTLSTPGWVFRDGRSNNPGIVNEVVNPQPIDQAKVKCRHMIAKSKSVVGTVILVDLGYQKHRTSIVYVYRGTEKLSSHNSSSVSLDIVHDVGQLVSGVVPSLQKSLLTLQNRILPPPTVIPLMAIKR